MTEPNNADAFDESVEERTVETPEGEQFEVDLMQQRIDEAIADSQRIAAEYANYRKRTIAEKERAREEAIGDVLTALLPMLDDFARAREHGELNGAFKSVSDSFDSTLTRFGLEAFGSLGEDFNPAIHEAMTHQTADGEGPTVTVVSAVYQAGFRRGDRVLRPARVAVEDIAKVEGNN